ncbi:MAG TPA: FlgD immunoglobulin-like domain containing protein [Candidatus Krumholzibacteria bacterium]
MKPFATGRASVVALVSCAVMVACAAVAHAEATIGLYRDSRGTACSFSDNAPGVVTVHVVFRPDDRGFRGVRFSAPVPSCFGGVWILDTPTERTHLIGDSQTGISVASSWCEDAPIEILQIQYYQNGSTSSCCEFPVLEDPFVHMIEANDCNFESFVASGLTSYFNANETCLCGTNAPPATPFNPSPANGEPAASVFSLLSWSGDDPDSNLAGFDLYLGTESNPSLQAAGITQPSYQPAQLAELTTYYWRVVARDEWLVETSGPVWSFTTRLTNSPPDAPNNPWPPDGSVGIAPTAQLEWQCQDVDAEPVVYDIYLGTSMSPPLAASGLTVPRYTRSPWDPDALTWNTVYYWRVVAHDAHGHEASGPVWSFRTRPENYPPEAPSSPSPAHGWVNQALNGNLTWVCSDKDAGDILVYDVYLGTTSPPPLVATNRTTRSYSYSALNESAVYYWRIIARDNHGAETAGSVWSFLTVGNRPPGVPYSPVPPANATGASVLSVLGWQCSDPNGDALKFDVYFGTDAVPPLVAANIATKSFTPGRLAFTTQYFWRIVARDPGGLETASATWKFTTRADGPPAAASSPSPAGGATGVSLQPTLTWQCTEYDGQPMTFDVYLGTGTPPPLMATGLTTMSFKPGGTLLTSARYYWQVVAHDNTGHETAGPMWYFNTRANSPPAAPSNPSPANNGGSIPAPMLAWSASDPDGQALTYDVYFGDATPPPLSAAGLTTRSYSPGVVAALRTYYWRIVASDGVASTSGPVWSFTTVATGDPNSDGELTTADAKCALDRYFGLTPCGPDHAADVDCSREVTPRDARCLHRRAVGMECVFCGEVPALTTPSGTPGVGVLYTWEWNDTLYCRLGVWNVPSLESFGFGIGSAPEFIRAQRRAVTNDWITVRSRSYGQFPPGGRVAGYTLTASSLPPVVATEFIDLRFLRTIGTNWVRIGDFRDDLAGAPDIYFEFGGTIPVLISRFDAAPVAGGIEVSWSLESDEAMESFTLYRSDGGAPPMPVASGAVNGRTGRHLDTSVSPGSAYQYELVIRTAAGGEFRSQPVRATMAAIELALHQNHPNPFNPQTAIRYDLPPGERTMRVRLWILDVNGRIVRRLVDEDQPGGSREVTWNGTDDRGSAVSSGVYFYVLDVEGKRLTRKLVLLK